MNSRSKILEAIGGGEEVKPLPEVMFPRVDLDCVEKFRKVVTAIGGSVIETKSVSGVREYIHQHIDDDVRVISTIPLIAHRMVEEDNLMHPLDNVEVTVVKATLAVAENGSVWITDEDVDDRLLPFICQHLMVVVNVFDIVSDMHQAYERIGHTQYQFATFIAGPSKTADIEQSLVLGAHGPRSMTIFLVNE